MPAFATELDRHIRNTVQSVTQLLEDKMTAMDEAHKNDIKDLRREFHGACNQYKRDISSMRQTIESFRGQEADQKRKRDTGKDDQAQKAANVAKALQEFKRMKEEVQAEEEHTAKKKQKLDDLEKAFPDFAARWDSSKPM